ncbi:insulin-like growth factor-binding protein 1 [Gastrophryne carolinensis]
MDSANYTECHFKQIMAGVRKLIAVLLPASLLFPTVVIALTEPLHCAECTEEKYALCPQVPAHCKELARESGCGCCLTCALTRGELCGVYTARCGKALRCRVKPDEPKPIQALTKGQGICMDAEDIEKLRSSDVTEIKDYSEQENTSPEGLELTQDQLPSFLRLFPEGFDKIDVWNTVFERIKAKKRKQKDPGPCQKELYKTMIKLQQQTREDLYRFHIPNCNKHGYYHTKQCETSLDGERGRCWCVNTQTGKKIPGTPEKRGDLNCQQHSQD